jgi:hypothetical protein
LRRSFAHALGICILFGLALLAGKPITAAENQTTYRQAENALTDALTKSDTKAVAGLLHDNFQWVDADGKISVKAQILGNPAPLAADNEGPIDVRRVDLGTAVRVLGIHHNERFAHLWVKGPEGWQAFVFLDIPIPSERAESTVPPKRPSDPDADCENPCRTIPYKPENAAQQGAMDTWFHLKNDEWHPNPEDWGAHADDDHETISPTADLLKLQHVAELAWARKLYGEHGAQPGEPVMSMRMFDFGNVVIQECLQGREGSARPRTWVFRIFVNKGDGWKIVLSAQARIKQA